MRWYLQKGTAIHTRVVWLDRILRLSLGIPFHSFIDTSQIKNAYQIKLPAYIFLLKILNFSEAE